MGIATALFHSKRGRLWSVRMRLITVFALTYIAFTLAAEVHEGVDLGGDDLTAQAQKDTESEERASAEARDEALTANKNQVSELATACKQEELNAAEATANKKAEDARNVAVSEAEGVYAKAVADAKNKQVQERGTAIASHSAENLKLGKEATQAKVEGARERRSATLNVSARGKRSVPLDA